MGRLAASAANMKANPKNPSALNTSSSDGEQLPDIYAYSNYRLFLQDYYKTRKKIDAKFSLRVLAAAAQFPSHGLLKYLMEGKRNLSKKTLTRLCPALGFDKNQTQYFENLVFFNQARSLEDKSLFYERIIRLQGSSTFKRLENSQLQVFRKWHSIVVREMLELKSFRNSFAWMSERMLLKVEQEDLRESMDLLLNTGLVKKSPNGFKLVDPDITTEDEVKSFLVKSYHLQMMKLAAWAQEAVPGSERDISSVCFSIKASELPFLKKQIQLMRKELKKFAALPGEGERVVQVNIQLFPLTKVP